MTGEPDHHSSSTPEQSAESLSAAEAERAAAEETRTLLTPRKIATQLLGFAVGIALLAWCIYGAIEGGDTEKGPSAWQRIADANWWLIAGLMGCTLVSLAANGAIFWIVMRPVKPLRLTDLELVNLAVSILNYAPIKIGLIARIAYHLRVDRVPLLHLAGWFAAIVFTLALAAGSAILATLVSPEVDLLWVALLVAQLLLGGLLIRALMTQAFVVRIGRGMHRMLSHPSALWGAIGLRLIDLGAFTGRVACAAAILQLDFSPRDILLVGFATLVLTFNPIGRVGIREAGVAIVASMISSAQLSISELDSQMQQLALLDSAGEALIIIPFGIVGVLWYRKAWRRATIERQAGEQNNAEV